MAEITPPEDYYYDLLPKEIKSKAFQNIPYPDIRYKCQEFCDNEEFWIRKAAHDIGQEYTNKLKDFFRQGTGSLIIRYLRVLAYNNVAVRGDSENIGSERFMAPSQMLKIGVDKNDETLIYWSLDKFNLLESQGLDYSQILKPLIDTDRFDELFYIIPKLKTFYAKFPYPRWFLQSSKSRNNAHKLGEMLKGSGFGGYEEFLTIFAIYESFLEGNLNEWVNNRRYIDFYYVAKKYYPNKQLPEPNVESTYIRIAYMLDAGYVNEAFRLLVEDPNDRENLGLFVDYISNKDDIKLAHKLLDIVDLNTKQYVINNFCIKGYSGSKVFDEMYPNFNYLSANYGYRLKLIAKSLYDFEGLYRLSLKIKDKESIIKLSRYEVNLYKPTLFEIFT